MRKIHPKITDAVFYLALLYSGYTFLQVYLTQRGLPPGVCPIETHNDKIVFSLVLIGIYFLMTFFTRKESKATPS